MSSVLLQQINFKQNTTNDEIAIINDKNVSKRKVIKNKRLNKYES